MIIVRDLAATAANGTTILSGVSFMLPPGTNLLVVGPSGCGKSTLLDILAGVCRHRVAGQVSQIGGPFYRERREPAGGGPDVGHHPERRQLRLADCRYAVQEAARAYSPYRTLGRQLADAGLHELERKAKLDHLLTVVGLDPARVCAAWPHQLSQGMLKRLHVAGVLAGGAAVSLFDEPTAGVDSSRRWAVMEAIAGHAARWIVATHDLRLVRHLPECHLLVLHRGRPAEFGPAAKVIAGPSSVTTRELFQATMEEP